VHQCKRAEVQRTEEQKSTVQKHRQDSRVQLKTTRPFDKLRVTTCRRRSVHRNTAYFLRKLKKSLLANAGFSKEKAVKLRVKIYIMPSAAQEAADIYQYFL